MCWKFQLEVRKWRKRFLPRKWGLLSRPRNGVFPRRNRTLRAVVTHFWWRRETSWDALINQYEENGASENVARIKTENAFLPVYRKELRKVLLGNLQWMRALEKDPTFKKVMETQKERKDSEGYDWLESTELANDKRKFVLNRLYEKQPIPQDQD